MLFFRLALCCVSLAAYLGNSAPAFAIDNLSVPEGGRVIQGDATITQPDTGRLNINQQSDRAVVNWDQFNIGKDAQVRIYQPDQDALIVNRVVGTDNTPTQILGRLRADGNVMVLDRDGVLFGRTATVDVNGLVASSSDIDPDQVMNATDGKIQLHARTDGTPAGAVINEGTITLKQGGFATLVAPDVRNTGTITANVGRVTLAGADTATVDLYGDGLLEIAVQPGTDISVEQTGRIMGADRVVLQTADVHDLVSNTINAGGVVQALHASTQNGTIRLEAGQGGDVNITGEHLARGNISITAGRDIHLGDTVHNNTYLATTEGTHISLNAGRTITTSGGTGYIRTNDTTRVEMSEQQAGDLRNLVRSVSQSNNNRIDIALGRGDLGDYDVGGTSLQVNNLHLTSIDADNRTRLTSAHDGLQLAGRDNSLTGLDIISGGTGLHLGDGLTDSINNQLHDVTITAGNAANASGLWADNAFVGLHDVTITGFGDAGILLTDGGSVTLADTLLANNRIGLFADGGLIDLTPGGNRIEGADIGLALDNATSANPQLHHNTLADTLFSGIRSYFVQLQNGAASGQTINARNAQFMVGNGGRSVTTAQMNSGLSADQYLQLADMIVDGNDDPGLGLIDIGAIPEFPAQTTALSSNPLLNHTEHYLTPYLPRPVTINRTGATLALETISPTDAAGLNALTPSAGGDEEEDPACALDGTPETLLAGAAASCI